MASQVAPVNPPQKPGLHPGPQGLAALASMSTGTEAKPMPNGLMNGAHIRSSPASALNEEPKEHGASAPDATNDIQLDMNAEAREKESPDATGDGTHAQASQPSMNRLKNVVSTKVVKEVNVENHVLQALQAQTQDSDWFQNLRSKYFSQGDDEDAEQQEFNALKAEAVLAYDAMSPEERNEKGKETIQKLTNNALTFEDVQNEWQTLSDDKQEIINKMKELFKEEGKFGKGTSRRVAYSTMKLQGQHDNKHVCFVPSGMTVLPSTVSKDILGKKAWRLAKPNMLLKIDCGSRHPAALSTSSLIDLKEFKQLRKAADKCVTNQLKSKAQRTGAKEEIDEEQKTLLVTQQINAHLKDSLSKEILPAILDAAVKTNNWIVIDRSNSTSSSASAELLLEMSLGISAKKRPTVFVFDSISRYECFKPSRVVNMQLLELCQVLSNCGGLQDTRNATDIHNLYKSSDFDDWEPYHFLRPDAKMPTDAKERELLEAEGDRRLPRKPEEAMINVDDEGCKRRCEDNRPMITPEVKWLYHYRQYLYSSGSHYVIFENSADSTFCMESNGVPWREACIFANGGNLSFERIQHSLSSGLPTVMLYNTGGVTQTFGSLYNWCVTRNVRIQNECREHNLDPKSVILSHTEVVSTEPWTKRFGVSTVSQLQNLVKRAPEAMRSCVAVVDILRENPEQVVDKVTACFASGGRGLPELGLGSAEEDVVLHAWKTHMTFTKNTYDFRRWADIFFYLGLLLTIFSASVAVLITKEDYTNGIEDQLSFDLDVMSFLKRLLLIIPITTSVLAAISGKKRYLQKWAALTTASAQIVSEIYTFRNGVLDYDEHWQSEKAGENGDEDAEDGKDEDSGDNAASENPRGTFVKRFKEISKIALDAVGESSLSMHRCAKLDLRDPEEKDEFKRELIRHVNEEVLGLRSYPFSGLMGDANDTKRKTGSKTRLSCCRRHKGPNTSVQPVDEEKEGDGGKSEDSSALKFGEDDFVSPMTIETYMEFRAKPVLRHLEKLCPPLSKRLSNLEMGVILVGAIGTLLAALDKARWVAISVAIGTSVVNIMQHEMLVQRLSSTNSALRELSNNQILMDSLSIVSKRTQEMKGCCVNTVETAVLETVTAWTGMTARPSVQVKESKKAKAA
eukprot:gnl/MRDRNA2_/MRDRNA2_90964_c0_seq1.p1 gnl/MRDRNA2_/MRDRNA2_90964_c0~~gnl/MRDRNA2_/MRDRNA2_90964_c0_seq1.p1  ORF type:complete len:1135 (-),score=217.83 gnl/MRDRNA2_/MRDRNA2_90964_c0_seq1:81-3485(-)